LVASLLIGKPTDSSKSVGSNGVSAVSAPEAGEPALNPKP